MHGPQADRGIRLVRRVDAPRERVFAAFTDPAQVALWWGPAGFTNTVHGMDARAGGVWRFTMHGPDGKDWPNRIDYTEVTPPARLRYRHGDEDAAGGLTHAFDVQIDFIADGPRQTRIEMAMVFPDRAARDRTLEFGAVEGGQQTMDRLETFLAQELVITRRFTAPRALVWRLLSEAEHLARWWGPVGLALGIESLDFRPGGHFHYRMGEGDAAQYGVFRYREIEPPHRLQFSNGFCDAAMKPLPAPFDPDWPLEILNTWTLDEEAGVTTLRLHGTPIEAGASGIATFRRHFESMRSGFGSTLDRMQAYLAEIDR
jgi:uncharacterized protein YndB with AHSA1/START domain